jgi:hypothetical protein
MIATSPFAAGLASDGRDEQTRRGAAAGLSGA